jgi:hypothetical protein
VDAARARDEPRRGHLAAAPAPQCIAPPRIALRRQRTTLAGMRMPPPAKPGEVNHAFVDRFTLVHASIGALYALAGLSAVSACVLALGWELLENPLKAYLPRLFPNATRDTLRNAVGDVLALMCGWTLTHWLANG